MMQQFIKKYFIILVVILLCTIAILPLFHPGFFPMHDDEQVARLYELNLNLQTGHIPPRLSQNLGYGYDYPLFNFYPSFVYYVAEIYHLLGFGYITSIKLMIGTGFILAALAMYFLSRFYFGKLAGIVSATFYTYASYHSVDVYVRGALPEFWTFVFLPILFLCYAKLARKPHTSLFLLTGFFLACLVLTHNLIAMMSAPFFFCFILFLLYTTKEKKRFLIATAYSVLIGVDLSAYFWLPGLFEKQYTMVNLLTTELADYAIHFVYPIQFLYSPWGYGGSTSGIMDGLSFQIGKIYLLSLFAVFLYALDLWKKQQKMSVLLLILIGLFLFSLFMQIDGSKFIWDSLKPVMTYIQFPWRFLVFSFFISSFAIGGLFLTPHPFSQNRLIKQWQWIIGIALIVFVIYKNHTLFQPAQYLTNATDQNYINKNIIQWETSNLAFEYVPKGIATKKSAKGNTVIAITKQQIAHEPITIIKGSIASKTVKDIPQQKNAIITAKTTGIIQINVYDFPGWRVYIDDKLVPFSSNNPLRLLQVTIPQGTHMISAIFTDTSIRLLSNFISIATAFLLVCYPFWQKYKNR